MTEPLSKSVDDYTLRESSYLHSGGGRNLALIIQVTSNSFKINNYTYCLSAVMLISSDNAPFYEPSHIQCSIIANGIFLLLCLQSELILSLL